jgi:hypothetical protein
MYENGQKGDLRELSEGVSTQHRIAKVEHKLFLQLHLNVLPCLHYCVATSTVSGHSGKHKRTFGGGAGHVLGRSEIFHFKVAQQMEEYYGC